MSDSAEDAIKEMLEQAITKKIKDEAIRYALVTVLANQALAQGGRVEFSIKELSSKLDGQAVLASFNEQTGVLSVTLVKNEEEAEALMDRPNNEALH